VTCEITTVTLVSNILVLTLTNRKLVWSCQICN